MTLSQNGRPSPLDELYEYAKNKGTITYQEVTDRLGNTFFEADQLEKVLDKLESLGVTVVEDHYDPQEFYSAVTGYIPRCHGSARSRAERRPERS